MRARTSAGSPAWPSAQSPESSSWSSFSLFFGLLDGFRQLIELVLGPFLFAEQRGHGLPRRAVEEHLHELLERRAARGHARNRRHVDVAEPLLPMFDHALGLELGQHRPHRRIAGRIGEPLPDLLRRSLAADLEEDVEDLALAPWKSRLFLHATTIA